MLAPRGVLWLVANRHLPYEAEMRACFSHVEEVTGDNRFDGGLGVYGPASHRGPFVHIDLRGYRARW